MTGDLQFSKAKQLGLLNDLGKTRTRARRELMDKILETWSKFVRKRDGYTCQWCGGKKQPQAHHIVPRSVCNNIGLFDAENGMTLCKDPCHFHRVKLDRKGYHVARDMYLARNGRPTYDELRKRYSRSGVRLGIPELELLHMKLKMDLKNLSL